ncbi:N-acetylmuramoyl-L-alanine amidase family protein, partial [Adlercreutzia muris]
MVKSQRFALSEKLLACSLAALLCFSTVPSLAFADDGADAEEHGAAVSGSVVEAELPEVDKILSSDSDSGTTSSAEPDSLGADDELPIETVGSEAASIEGGVAFVDEEVRADLEVPEDESEGADTGFHPQPLVGFVYIDEAMQIVGEVQNVVFALSDDDVALESATLRYLTLSGERSVEACEYDGGAALFEITNLEEGKYQLLAAEYKIAGCDELFTERLEGDTYAFEVQSSSDARGIEISALALDGQGGLVEDASTKEVIEEAVDGSLASRAAAPVALPTSASASRAASYPGVVVALDAGHGGSDSGATGNGLLEKNLTLSIAKYCQAALQRNGISVFMTRSTDVYVGLSERVQKAAAAGASVFVSLHINSATPAAYGCEVWVPNSSSYKHDTYVAGKTLGEKVIAKLAALGLHNRGVKHRDSENGSKYPDGSVADYYSVINGARQRGIPGIIVEHAFISNSGDALKMQSDTFLKRLGEADAQGIIEAINSGVIKGGGQLYNDGRGYRYRTSSGADLKNDWVSVNGYRYYMGSDGYALRWEQRIDGKAYYFDGQSRMTKGWVT